MSETTNFGAQSDIATSHVNATSKAFVDIYSITNKGTFYLEVVDNGDLDSGGTIVRKKIFPQNGKWRTQDVEFIPRPSGDWLPGGDYNWEMRRQLIFTPQPTALVKGSLAIVRDFDKEWLLSKAVDSSGNPIKNTGVANNFSLAYYNGSTLRELPYDYTDAGELWFELQQDLPALKLPNGTWEGDKFYGAYYIYYSVGDAEPTKPNLNAISKSKGIVRDAKGACVIDDINGIPEEGHVIFDYTPDWNMSTITEDTFRYIIDRESGNTRFSVCFYGKSLYVIIVNENGFRSIAAFRVPENEFAVGQTKRYLIQWGEETTRGKGNLARKSEAWWGSVGSTPTQLQEIPNRYDETIFDQGAY